MRTFFKSTIIIHYLLLLVYGQERLVTIGQGTVRGHKHESRALYEFLGVPYATAPTGRDKFKAPLEAPNWEGTLDAVDGLVLCPQNIEMYGGLLSFKEDCLVANIFVPENNDGLKPVIVIIHGGAFVLGFGNMAFPYNLVEKDIVAVTFNYRLAVNGFLCMHTENIPGNAGLKDQLAALRWVKSNIEQFGGDPNDITLSGYSAGSVSAELLMLSPAANNLFNKVILESGSALSTWAVNPKSLEFAKNLASENGANDVENVENVEDFYLSLSHEELIALGSSDWFNLNIGPCIDEDSLHEEAVIEDLPYNILTNGSYSKLPLLTGYTDGEGLMLYEFREQIMTDINADFSSALPPNFDSYTKMDETKAIDLIKEFYFEEDVITDVSIRNFTDYFTDTLFSYWIIESAKLHAQNSSVPVYLYEFTYITSTDGLILPDIGATHCAQTNIINDFALIGPVNRSENDILVQTRTVDMWANFIKHGEPVSIVYPEYWEPLDAEEMNYLVIGLDLENKTAPLQERLQFWEKIWLYNAASSIHASVAFFILSFTLLLN